MNIQIDDGSGLCTAVYKQHKTNNSQSSPCLYMKGNSWSEWNCTAQELWQWSVEMKKNK